MLNSTGLSLSSDIKLVGKTN